MVRAHGAGAVDLGGHRAVLVDVICARHLGQRERREVADLWARYGPVILGFPGWSDPTNGPKGVDADLDRRVGFGP